MFLFSFGPKKKNRNGSRYFHINQLIRDRTITIQHKKQRFLRLTATKREERERGSRLLANIILRGSSVKELFNQFTALRFDDTLNQTEKYSLKWIENLKKDRLKRKMIGN